MTTEPARNERRRGRPPPAALLAAALLGAGLLAATLLAGEDPESEQPPRVSPALERPQLDAPRNRASVSAVGAFFSVSFAEEGYLQVQYARDQSFDEETVVCDSGWYPGGFHTESAWELPGAIGFSEVECALEPGWHFWRARWAPTEGGALPSESGEPVSEWSEARAFRVLTADEEQEGGHGTGDDGSR